MHQHTNVAPTAFRLELDTELANRYRREAVTRELTVRGLITSILEVVYQDKLIDAVLDAPPQPDRKIGRPKGSTTSKPKSCTALKLKSAAVG
jgi:hypothetical protein